MRRNEQDSEWDRQKEEREETADLILSFYDQKKERGERINKTEKEGRKTEKEQVRERKNKRAESKREI